MKKVNAQQPTRITQHMDFVKEFAFLEWVEEDLMILQSIKTAANAADTIMLILSWEGDFHSMCYEIIQL